MDSITFKHSGKPLTDSDIEDVEKSLKIHFPLDVRALYNRSNGGAPSPYMFGPLDTAISEFMPLTSLEPGTTSVECYKNLVLEQHLAPREMFPFAVDGAGDYFFVDTGFDHGPVYFYDSQADDPLINLHMDFKSFWEALKKDEDESDEDGFGQ